MPRNSKQRIHLTPREAAASAAVIAMFAGFVLFYFLGEAMLGSTMHPQHWLSGAIGAATGYGVAYGVVYWLRSCPRW